MNILSKVINTPDGVYMAMSAYPRRCLSIQNAKQYAKELRATNERPRFVVRRLGLRVTMYERLSARGR